MRRPCGRRSPLRAAAAAAQLNEEDAGRRQIDPSSTGQPSCRPPARPPIGGIGARGISGPPCCRRLASCASEYGRPTPACMTMHHCPATTTHASAALRAYDLMRCVVHIASIARSCCADRNCFTPPGNSSSSSRCGWLMTGVRARSEGYEWQAHAGLLDVDRGFWRCLPPDLLAEFPGVVLVAGGGRLLPPHAQTRIAAPVRPAPGQRGRSSRASHCCPSRRDSSAPAITRKTRVIGTRLAAPVPYPLERRPGPETHGSAAVGACRRGLR